MLRIINLIVIVGLLTFSCESQTSEKNGNDAANQYFQLMPEKFIEQFPGQLSENSGLIQYNNLLWTFNDSGGKNSIYGCDKSGEIKIEVELDNAENRDWEDIAQDDEFIYVGDFGNNNGVRKDLSVYKIDKSTITDESLQTIDAQIIRFAFSDQQQFTFSSRTTRFDCESIANLNNRLYVFTKNWKDETTTVYHLPKQPGEYIIEPVDSFQVNGLITGADFSPDFSTLALVGYHDYKPLVWLFKRVSEEKLFGNKNVFIAMDSLVGAQTEGIYFLGKDTLLISCESTFNYPAQVFMVDLKTLK